MDSSVMSHYSVDYQALESATELFGRGDLAGLKKHISNKCAEDERYIFGLLCGSLYVERAHDAYPLSEWLLQQPELLPVEQSRLDQCFCIAIYTWRSDAIEIFLALGANPNQPILPKRYALDICLNRTEHDYSCEKSELDDAVASLRRYSAKTYIEHKYEQSLHCWDIFGDLASYDDWVELMVEDLAALTPIEQSHWQLIIKHAVSNAKTASKGWKREQQKNAAGLDQLKSVSLLEKWLRSACQPRSSLVFGDLRDGPYYKKSDSTHNSFDVWRLAAKNSLVLNGLLWTLADIDPHRGQEVALELVQSMYAKLPELGIRDVSLANASFAVLLETEVGRNMALALAEQTENPTAKKKMKAMLGA